MEPLKMARRYRLGILGETVRYRRYEAKLKTKRNEQIFDLTGGKNI